MIQRGATIVYSDHIVTEQCWVCGVWFGLANSFVKQRGQDGATFYCPNGCKIRYGTPEVTRLRQQLEDTRSRVEFWQGKHKRAEAKRRAQKAQTTKLKKRIANGVCPCCNRTFANVERHMKSQHPDYPEPAQTEASDG